VAARRRSSRLGPCQRCRKDPADGWCGGSNTDRTGRSGPSGRSAKLSARPDPARAPLRE